jgi:hypothetical protein
MPRKRKPATKKATLAKPTPGPYRLCEHIDGASVRGRGRKSIVWASSNSTLASQRQALANAQAFIDGMAARETLEKIRREIETSAADNEGLVGAICAILDEEPKS